MSGDKRGSELYQVGITTAFIALAFVGTILIRIPIPATGGYFNLGDTFVMAAALLYGPWVGALVGLIGPALSDAIGFPQYVLATAVVKFCEGGLVGLLSRQGKPWSSVLALAVGILVLVLGYYLFEAFVYPWLAKTIPFFGVTDPKAALAEVPPNLLQGVLSAMIAFGIARLLHGRTGQQQ
jgi:uncharacterized membrane protein